MNRIVYFLLFVVIIGCDGTPYSSYPMHEAYDDKLSDTEKIQLVEDRIDQITDHTLLYAVAVLYENNQAWEQAFMAIQKAIALSPLNPTYHTQKAIYAFELGNFELAYNETNIARELGFSNYQQDILLARLALTLGDSVASKKLMADVVNKYPQHPTVKYLSAVLSLQQEDTVVAFDLFEQSIKLEPEDEEVVLSFVDLLQEVDSMRYAERMLLGLIEANGRDDYNYELFELFSRADRLDTAVYFLAREFELNPTRDKARKLIDAFWSLELYDSVVMYSVVMQDEFNAPRMWQLYQARGLDQLSYYDSAFNIYTRLYENDTTDSIVGAEMAILQRKIRYLQRRREQQRKLADSLSRTLPVLTF